MNGDCTDLSSISLYDLQRETTTIHIIVFSDVHNKKLTIVYMRLSQELIL